MSSGWSRTTAKPARADARPARRPRTSREPAGAVLQPSAPRRGASRRAPHSPVLYVANPSTIFNFDIELADADRGVYEALALRVACHPSESEEFLVARVLAYCLEFTEGLAFGKGLSEPDDPALTVRDLTGQLRAWIEVGAPDARRVHKASKAAPRVVIYTHKDPAVLVRQWQGEKIHRAEAVELLSLDRTLIAGVVARLKRRMAFTLSVTGGHLYLTIGDDTLTGEVLRHPLG